MKIRSLSKFIPVLFLVITFLTISYAVIAFQNLRILNANEVLVDHTNLVITRLNRLLADLKSAEGAQRNYIVTQKVSDNSVYTQSVDVVTNDLTSITSLTSDNPVQQERLPALKALINSRIDSLNKGISLNETQGFYAAQNFIYLDQSTEKYTQIEDYVNQMKSDETSLLAQRQQQSTQSSLNIIYMISTATLLLLILLGVSYYLIRRELNLRKLLESRKNEFISIASHELKSPITSMQLFNQMLSKELKKYKNKRANHITQRLTQQIEKMIDLINSLLDISKIQEGHLEVKMEKFNLNTLVSETIGDLQPMSKHKLILKGKIKQDITGDKKRIGEVITNLLTNAVKYSPDAFKVHIYLKTEKNKAVIQVKDYGIGIGKSNLDKIFDRFYRIENNGNSSFQGLGLGLYISAEIVKRHHGLIQVESEEGKGTTFTVILPLSQSRKKLNFSLLKRRV